MLLDRDPVWNEITDKLRARNFVEKRLGKDYLIPILWVGDSADDLPIKNLPQQFIIKTNHGCGFNIIITNKNEIEQFKVINQINNWLRQNFTYSSFIGMAWAYKNIVPRVYVESFIGEEDTPPLDYKFFCFSGRAEYLQISFDRFGDPSERILDRDFNLIEVWNGVKIYRGVIERPIDYEKMLDVAENLSAGFDFIRVDLYNVKGKIYFGEYTCYPAAGLAPFVPRKWDFIFGEKWIIK